MLAASFFDCDCARLHAVTLGVSHGMITVQGGGIVRAYPYGQVRLDDPFAHAPCVLHFADGARCEVADPDMRCLLAMVLERDKTGLERLRERWYDLVFVAILLAACAALLMLPQ